MHLLGLVALGYMWSRIVKAAHEKIAAGDQSPHLATKPLVGLFFVERILPETSAYLAKIQSGAAVLMTMPAEAF
jgi:acyl-CoA dehydrogenase